MKVRLYLDDEQNSFREIENSERFDLNTTDFIDGPHVLRIETVENGIATGSRFLSFTVRNGPGIAVAGLQPGDEVRGRVSVLVNASAAGIDSKFDAHSMETHRGIPFWMGGFAAIVILACAAYLATDSYRQLDFTEQAETVAVLQGRDLSSDLTILTRAPEQGNPQQFHLADGTFLEIMSLEGRTADLANGAQLFAARCSGCHGASAQGTLQEKVTLGVQGIYPRLAGQSRSYIYRQLFSFAEGWRDSLEMVPMAKSLADQDRLDIATYIETLVLEYPARSTVSAEILARGRHIAEVGIIENGVTRCTACHGTGGAGGGANFPYLAGQFPKYLEAQLRNWQHDVRRNDWRGLMRPVVWGLSDQDIAAVSAYFANARPRAARTNLETE